MNLAMEIVVSHVYVSSVHSRWRSLKRISVVSLSVDSSSRVYSRKSPMNLCVPRRTKLPPEFGTNLFLKKRSNDSKPDEPQIDSIHENDERGEDGDVVWEADELEAISSLFQGRVPQKPGKLTRERPLPLPLPHKLRPIGLPTPKRHVKLGATAPLSRGASVSKQVCRNPDFLIKIAREIRDLPLEKNASAVLDKKARYLHKGSLSLTVQELGHMDLPDRALQTFSWAQKQCHLYPDDWLLAAAVEVLAKNHELKVPVDLEKFVGLASRGVIEAMVRGFIQGGSLKLAWRLLRVAKHGGRMLDSGIYAKLILEFGKNPDRDTLVLTLLDELAELEDFKLKQQDCTAIMKICIRLGKFEVAESLFNWYKQSGRELSVVMYTTMVHSRYSERKYREALAIVWDMEDSNCLFDLPAYRVVIKLLAEMDDLPRTVRYFSKLKEAGFSPTYDIYRSLFGIYIGSGRISKFREICREAEMSGFKLEKQVLSKLLELESVKMIRI